MNKVEKRILVSIVLFAFLFSLVSVPYKVKASTEPVSVEIKTDEKITAYEGMTISFDLKYKVLDPNAIKSGYKLTIKLPEILKNVQPEYKEQHFSSMEQGDGLVTLTFKEGALWGSDIPLEGFTRIWATIGEIKETKAYPVTVTVGSYTDTFYIDGKVRDTNEESRPTTGYPKLSKGANLSYNNKGEYIIPDINDEVEYFLCVNYDKVSLENVQVKDTLPQGMELVDDSIRVEEFDNTTNKSVTIKPNSNISKKEFSVSLGNINKMYYIYYKVKIVSQEGNYRNSAEITYNNITESSAVNAKIKTGAGALNVKKMVDKSEINVEEDQTVTYKIIFSSYGDFDANSINFEDVIDGRVKIKSISSTDQFTVKLENNKITAVNDKKAIMSGNECFIEIVVDMSDVKPGETINNLAVINGTKTNEVSTKKTYPVEIFKCDSNNKSLGLNGAEFEVKDSGGQVLRKIVTDEFGKGALILSNSGNYTLKEVKAPEGYELLKYEIPFTIDEVYSNIKIIEVPNTKIIPEVKPQPQPIPEVNQEPKPQPQPIPEVNPEPKPQPQPIPEVKPEPKPQPQPIPEVKPEPKPQPQPMPEVKPEPKPQPQPIPEAKPEPNPEPQPMPEAKPEPESKVDIKDEVVLVDNIKNEAKNELMLEATSKSDLAKDENKKSPIRQLPQTGAVVNTLSVQTLGVIMLLLGSILVKRKE